MSINGDIGPELLDAATIMMREVMCVEAGEHVLITADINTERREVDAIADASHRLGAKVVSMTLTPALPFQGRLADPYIPDPMIAAAQNCDVWVDVCMPYIGGSALYDRAMKNGRTRYLLAADIGASGIVRIFGKADLDQVLSISDMFSAFLAESSGKACRLMTPAGTDVRFQLAHPEGLAIKRASKPGGYFVPGTVVVIPELESVKGTIVCESAFHEFYTPLEQPYRFEVNGKIRSVSGGGAELEAMERALKRAGNGDYGYIVHFSCGFHPTARYTGKSFIEDQRVPGCDAVGFGLPPWVEGGGENHPDCVMRDQSFWIGDELIVDRGLIVSPPELARAAEGMALARN